MPFKQTIKGFSFFSIFIAVFTFLFISNSFADTNLGKTPDVCSSLTSDNPIVGKGAPLSSLASCQASCKTACLQEKKAGNTHCYSCPKKFATCYDIGATPAANAQWCMPGGACENNPNSYCESVGMGLGLACVVCKQIPDECKVRIGANTSNLATCKQTCPGKCVFVNQYQAVNNPAKWVGCYKCDLPREPTCESLGWGATTQAACTLGCPNGQCNPVKMTGGFGNGGPLGLSLTCFQCQKNPPPPPVKDLRCYGAQEGECEGNSCPVTQECQGYTEKGTNGESYYCHECNDLDSCQVRGYYADPSCKDQCPAEDTCESVDVDKNDGSVVPPGQTREKGSTLPCYRCVEHPVVSPQGCSAQGYFADSLCGGKCSASDCDAQTVDKKTHEMIPLGKTVDANTVETCYVCRTHSVAIQDQCSKDDMWSDPSCGGKCVSGAECVAVPNNGKTCYMCRQYSIAKLTCPEGAVEGACPSACASDEDCSSVNASCVQCTKRPSIATGKTETGGGTTTGYNPGGGLKSNACMVGDEGSCSPNPCGEQDCQMITKKSNGAPVDCHMCKEKPKTALKFDCAKEGFSGDANCDGKCSADQSCNFVSVNSINGGGTCYACYSKPVTAKKFDCSKEGFTSDTSCNGKCSSDEYCSFVFVSGMSGGGTCYTCYAKSKTATGKTGGGTTTGYNPGGGLKSNACMTGDEGSCIPNPCGDTQDCQMISKKSNGAPVDCHMCKEKPKTATGGTTGEGPTAGYNPGAFKFKCKSGIEGSCANDPCPDHESCLNETDLDYTGGMSCHYCSGKKENTCVVGDPGNCAPNPCGYNEDCQMVSKKDKGAPLNCHMCKERPKTATGTTSGGMTTGYTGLARCDKDLPGLCDSQSKCPDNQECVNTSFNDQDGSGCHKCQPKLDTNTWVPTSGSTPANSPFMCVESIPGPCATGSCADNQICENTYVDKLDGTTCHECVSKHDRENLMPTGPHHTGYRCYSSLPGACTDNSCPSGQICENTRIPSGFENISCHDCLERKTSGVPPTSTGYNPGGGQIINRCPTGDEGGCYPNPCSSDQQCNIVYNGQGKYSLTCHECEAKPKTATGNTGGGTTTGYNPGGGFKSNACMTGDEGGCTPNPCGNEQDCQMISKKSNGAPLDCHMCKEKPKTATGVVDTGGTTTGYNPGGGTGYTLGNCPVNWDYFDDSNCRGKCPSEDCIAQTIDTKTNVIVPQNQTSAHQVQTCYTCKMSYTNYENGCDKAGYYYDDYCDDDCPESACDEVAVDKKTLQPTAWSYAYNNDVLYCYKCISYEKWLERVSHYYYIIIVVETPYGRFVLNHSKDDPTAFHPASVMALAKVDSSTGMVSNIKGDPKKIIDFIGGFNVGFGSSGIATTGQVGMDQLSNSLQSSLQSGGDFGSNCFDSVQKQADSQAASQGTPTGQDISEGKSSHKDNKVDKATNEDQIKQSEDAGLPAVSGPVIACGTQNGNKVLKIFDAGGRLVDSITQGMLKANPSIILQKLGRAQTLTDKLMVKSSFGFAGNSTGIANKPAETNSTVPNDPLYQASNKKKRGFGIFGGDAPSAYKALSAGSDIMSGPSGPKPEDSIEDQYYLRTIGYTPLSDPNSAWNAVDANQKNIVVAVVDSGLDLDHPDGPQYIWTNPKDDAREGFANDLHGWNFVNENTDLRDFRGHGTSVAGIIAAKSNNGIGMAGINPGAVIMPVKIANDKGETDSLAVYRGINFAVNHGAKIINLSIGGKTISKLEQEAIERANAMGVLVVMAAGNTNDSLMTFGPSSSKYGLAVGMTDFDGSRSNVSNWGPNLAVTAPGEQIYSLCSKDTKEILPSLRKNGYYKQSGTSFSAPMVTATASLVWAKNPQLTNQQVADIIRSTATPMGGNSWSDGTGFGLLNASAALRATADEKLIAMFTNVHFNRDMREQLTSVDVYGTVRGKFKEFAIEAGKGKLTRSFRQIAGPFTEQYNYQLIARLVIKDVLRGSKEWVLRLKVTDNEGKEHDATMILILPDK